ncbi:hypothetical protein CTEN210_01148 [Chaetoceros tenuissimus]|uniref:PA domain-containing protein n=1 Tax=Chaetoceros tenuissimus TaxID=426638 RepID=A0AAD3GZT5_9STRA|nr:hypothetical protein CTEN210_01148 [Chaetoceros tenuissimus]
MFKSVAMKGLVATALYVSSAAASKMSSSVKVYLPKELSRPAGYDHREALFGIPPYGESILENVIYANHDMCYPIEKSGWKAPFILLVDRGGCTFVQKVRNAQHAGATAVIIADNRCQCKHEKICRHESNQVCERQEPIMADDESGYDITIPSVLMFKQDADPIKAALEDYKSVRMELTWSLPNPDSHVEWYLWTSPTDYMSSEFNYEFGVAVEAFGGQASFTPNMYIYDGITEGKCRNAEGKSECYTLCTNEGRYCAADPDLDLDYGISGADVVAESLRRLCIWELYGKDDGVGMKYWNYVKEFINICDTSELFMKEDCVKRVMAKDTVQIDYDAVDQCAYNHGGLERPEENDLLQKQLDEKEANEIAIMPAVYVNGVAIRGELQFATVFKAICAGYAPGTEPRICTKCSNCHEEKACVVHGGKCPGDGATVGSSTFVASMASLVLVFSGIGASYYIRRQRIMKEQVSPKDSYYYELVDFS